MAAVGSVTISNLNVDLSKNAQLAPKDAKRPVDPESVKVARGFLLTAVVRKNLNWAYDHVHPSLKGQLTFINGTGLDYVSYNEGKPPFDNVYVRRAFSAALDRKQMIQDAAGGLGVPMIHITLPMMTGAPPIAKIGVGFDPKYAVEQLALSPYPGCKGFPEVTSVSQS